MKKTVAQDATNRQVSHDDQQIIYNSSRSIVGTLQVKDEPVSSNTPSSTQPQFATTEKNPKLHQQKPDEAYANSFNTKHIRSARAKLVGLSNFSRALTVLVLMFVVGSIAALNNVSNKPPVDLSKSGASAYDATVDQDTLNANYSVNGATGWTPFNGTVYKADQSASPGSGSFYWPGNTISEGNLLHQQNLVSVTPGEVVTISAKVKSDTWPVNEAILGLIDQNGTYIQSPWGSEDSTVSAGGPTGQWSESAKNVIIPKDVTGVRLQLYTYSTRSLYIDDLRIVRGADRTTVPKPAKRSFDGYYMKIDSEGNTSVRNPVTGVYEDKFLFGLHMAYQFERQSVERYKQIRATGWDVNVWSAPDVGNVSRAAEAGIYSMWVSSAYVSSKSDWGWTANTSLYTTQLANINAATTKLSNGWSAADAVIGYWWDNENSIGEQANAKKITDAMKSQDVTYTGQRKRPIISLHGIDRKSVV